MTPENDGFLKRYLENLDIEEINGPLDCSTLFTTDLPQLIGVNEENAVLDFKICPPSNISLKLYPPSEIGYLDLLDFPNQLVIQTLRKEQQNSTNDLTNSPETIQFKKRQLT